MSIHSIEKQQIQANGLTFDCRTSGLDNNGEYVVLLHGFPETSHMWIPLMLELADKGYRVIAPNQRGFSPGASPYEVSAYEMPDLAADVIAIAEAFGATGKFHLAGHDWGACVGWGVVEQYQDRLLTWSALSVPHLGAYFYSIEHDPIQQEKSAYVKSRLDEGVAEKRMAADDFAELRRDKWYLATDEQIADYISVFSRPECMRGALNYYRANNMYVGRGNVPTMAFARDITVPVLYIQGLKDHAVGMMSVELSRKYMQGEYKHVQLDISHWMMQESESVIVETIADFIQTHPA